MVKRKKKSNLAGALSKALENHASDETDFGMERIDLPAGINRGVAKLVTGRIGQFKSGQNEGQDFVYLGGVIVSPETVMSSKRIFSGGKVQNLPPEEMVVKGQQTGMTIPLCDTLKGDGETVTLDTHIKELLNELRKLGGEECTSEGLKTNEDLEALMTSLIEANIYFRFSTSGSKPTEQYPDEKVWENWFGSKDMEDYEEDEDEDVNDNTGGENEDIPPKKTKKAKKKVPVSKADDGDEPDEIDFIALGKEAKEGDEAAMIELGEAAKALDIDPETIDSWVGVAEAIIAASSPGDGNGDDDDDDEAPPKRGEVWRFKPPKKRKFATCEVTAVFSGKQTCNLKNLDDPTKTYKAVSWDKLEE